MESSESLKNAKLGYLGCIFYWSWTILFCVGVWLMIFEPWWYIPAVLVVWIVYLVLFLRYIVILEED